MQIQREVGNEPTPMKCNDSWLDPVADISGKKKPQKLFKHSASFGFGNKGWSSQTKGVGNGDILCPTLRSFGINECFEMEVKCIQAFLHAAPSL